MACVNHHPRRDDRVRRVCRLIDRLRKPPIKLANAGEGLVGPVAPRVALRKPEAVRQQHGMRRHGLRGVEILGHQCRRHHERLSRVRKSFACAAIGRKLPRRIERVDAGEIVDAVGVFGVVEPTEYDATGVARQGAGLGLEEVMEPLPDLGTLFVARLGGLWRRHLPAGHHLGNPLPHLHLAANRFERREAREVDISFFQIAGMAILAVVLDEWHHPLVPRRQWLDHHRFRSEKPAGCDAGHDRTDHDPQPLCGGPNRGERHRLTGTDWRQSQHDEILPPRLHQVTCLGQRRPRTPGRRPFGRS